MCIHIYTYIYIYIYTYVYDIVSSFTKSYTISYIISDTRPPPRRAEPGTLRPLSSSRISLALKRGIAKGERTTHHLKLS